MLTSFKALYETAEGSTALVPVVGAMVAEFCMVAATLVLILWASVELEVVGCVAIAAVVVIVGVEVEVIVESATLSVVLLMVVLTALEYVEVEV